MKALTKEKKEKENVSIYLELINMKNVSLLLSKKFKRNITKVERYELKEDKKE